MRILAFLPLLSIWACTSVGTNVGTSSPAENLPGISQIAGLSAQELDAGGCGVFFWKATTPRTFVFFQKQGQARASLYDQDTEIVIETSQDTSNLDIKIRLDLRYKGGGYESITVKGNFGDELEGGRRISGATITINKLDGWQEILPVNGVYVCR